MKIPIFGDMQSVNVPGILVENIILDSARMNRAIQVDFYLPVNIADPSSIRLLLINDGQDMENLGLESILSSLYQRREICPLLCAAIHAGPDRKREYGVAGYPDYLGRGDKAANYVAFVIEELLPFIGRNYALASFREKAFAGFSLGGLMALDIVWAYPGLFQKAGVFSGSLWWRSIDQTEKEYDDDKHRIIHQRLRNGRFHPGQKFFFQCGNMDETMDRNHNGIIDSIDDTLDAIRELEAKGYDREKDICYLELPDGRHDVPTWARAMPFFLKWAFKEY